MKKAAAMYAKKKRMMTEIRGMTRKKIAVVFERKKLWTAFVETSS